MTEFDSLFQLFDNATTFRCISCGKYVLFDELYVSPNCFVHNETDHYYCIQCASKLINESLSLLNQPPKCIRSNCNKSFNVSLSKATNTKLFTQYKMDHGNIKQHKNEEFLLHGYIRQNKNTSTMLFPKEIKQLIHDFYKLVFFTELPCDNCNASGFEQCVQCNGRGTYESTCAFCTKGTVNISSACTDCESGKKQIKVACNCSMNYYAVCATCDGYGVRSLAGTRCPCSDCDGTGDYCPNNCCNGFITDVMDCDKCKGSGKLCKKTQSRSQCVLCDGQGNSTSPCCYCQGKSKIECYKCQSNGSIFYTDFNKVISKQKYCHKCNMYHPSNKIAYWSGCNHTYCNSCILHSNYIHNEINNDRIPLCPLPHCQQEMTEDNMKLIHQYCKYTNSYYFNEWYLDNLINSLKMLKIKKYNFDCFSCANWHSKKDMLLLSGCGCKLTADCGKILIQNQINRRKSPVCNYCGAEIVMDDIELICGKDRVYRVQRFKYSQQFERLITRQRTKINQNDIGKVLKIKHDGLNYNDIKLNNKIIDFLRFTNIKIKDIEYLNIIPTKMNYYLKRQVPLIQLYLKDEKIAKNINAELYNVTQTNMLYEKWSVGFWEIYNQQKNNYKYKNGGQYNNQIKQQFNRQNNVYFNRNPSPRNNYCNHRSYYQNNINDNGYNQKRTTYPTIGGQTGLVCGIFEEQRGKINQAQKR